jgi:HD-like signal output (HDOD) protein
MNMDNEKVFILIEQSKQLPILPRNVSEILEMLKNPVGLDIDKLVQKVSQSEQLNSIMLKNLNSGYFQLNKKVETIKEAVVYLGMQTVQNLLIFFMTNQLFSSRTSEKRRIFDMSKYWKHVLGTSVASCILASRTKQGDKYKLFSYGLVHDIGISVLDVCLPEMIDEINSKLQKGIHQIVAEKTVLGGLTHADIGAWLCRKWNIREDIINIVEFHHSPLLSRLNTCEVQLLHLADIISTEYYEKLLGINLNHGISNQMMVSLGLTEADIKYVVEKLPEEMARLNNYFIT